jgi:glycosyltransferase involved in cell wall biosynthesis
VSVAAIAMVRDEADIVGSTVAHMLTQVDHVIVADNGSVDGTRDILASLDVELVDDPERGYYQSRKMTALAAQARAAGHDWVVPFDADEVWYSPFGRIADVLDGIGVQWLAAPASLYDHVPAGWSPGRSPRWRPASVTTS